MNQLLDLFCSFARVGVLTFGGGYAMLPMLQREVVEAHGWATEDELLDYYAIAQCTPGVIAVNTATFVGQKTRGTAGAIAATLGLVFPSLIIITVIAAGLQNFSDLPVVKNAFAGIRACVWVLILRAVIKLWKKAVVDKTALVTCLLVFFAATFTQLSTVVLVLLAGFSGVVLQVWLAQEENTAAPEQEEQP